MRFRFLIGMIFPFALLGANEQPNYPGKSSKDQGGPELPAPVLKGDVSRLKKEREELRNDREEPARENNGDSDSLSAEREKLRKQMLELLKKINDRKMAPSSQETLPPFKSPGDDSTKALDPLNQAQSLYRTGNYEASLRAFRLVDGSAVSAEDRIFIQYMMASCLRRQGKLNEASAIYREVAEGREDSFLAECAVWQLSNIRWRRDLESQLEDLRQRRKAK